MPLAGGIDIGGTRTKIGIVAGDGRVVRRATVSTGHHGEPLPLVDRIVSTLRPMLEREGEIALGIGVSVAGFLDREHTAMIANANLPALCGFPLRHTLEDRLALPCHLEVDSNAAVLGEYRYGSGKDATRLLGVTVGTGLGGGVIIDGALLRYTGECAGDIGHIILDPKGRRCTCGARGCLEALVCSAALSARAGRRSVREIVSAAGRGKKPAVNALAETGRWLGLGLASLTPLFAPERIVIGGGVAAAGELLLGPTVAAYREYVAPEFVDKVQLVGAALQGWEGMVGAASLLFHPLP